MIQGPLIIQRPFLFSAGSPSIHHFLPGGYEPVRQLISHLTWKSRFEILLSSVGLLRKTEQILT